VKGSKERKWGFARKEEIWEWKETDHTLIFLPKTLFCSLTPTSLKRLRCFVIGWFLCERPKFSFCYSASGNRDRITDAALTRPKNGKTKIW